MPRKPKARVKITEQEILELRQQVGLPGEPQPKIRRCLGCDEQFISEWTGHRICEECKQRQKNGINLEDYRNKDA